MKKTILLFGSLLLALVALQAVADPPAERADSPADEVAMEPTAEEAPRAPEAEPEEGGMSLEVLPETPFSEPVAAACVLFQCRQDCRNGCSPGCICLGFCNAEDECECNEICF